MVKFLLHYAKHEVVLPKTTLIVEGKTCNRLFLLVNGVLQATHSKHVSKVRRSSDVDAVSPRPPSRFSLCTFSSLIAILDAILDATSMRSQVREMQAARNKSYANGRTTYSDRGTFVTDEVSEDESRITRASRMTMGGKRTAAARSLKHLQEESFNHGHHGGGGELCASLCGGYWGNDVLGPLCRRGDKSKPPAPRADESLRSFFEFMSKKKCNC